MHVRWYVNQTTLALQRSYTNLYYYVSLCDRFGGPGCVIAQHYRYVE